MSVSESPRTPSPECSSSSSELSGSFPEAVLCVLKFGKLYQYTIPSFSVITVHLRHALAQVKDENGKPRLVDFFFRDDDSLNDVLVPVEVEVLQSCNVEVKKLSIDFHYR